MNVIHLRFGANAIDDPQVLLALQAGSAACQRLSAQYSIRMTRDHDWFLEVYIGSTPFSPEQDLVAATLIRRVIPFDVTFSTIGADGDPVATMYGLQTGQGSSLQWFDEETALESGCGTESLNPEALSQLGINVEILNLNGENLVYSPTHADQLRAMNPTIVQSLVDSVNSDPVVRDTARYLSLQYEQRLTA
jgi:hypothetical protein